jgi:hypothetical protein
MIFVITIAAGHVAWRCAREAMLTRCGWQNGMSAGGATVRMRLEIGCRDNP